MGTTRPAQKNIGAQKRAEIERVLKAKAAQQAAKSIARNDTPTMRARFWAWVKSWVPKRREGRTPGAQSSANPASAQPATGEPAKRHETPVKWRNRHEIGQALGLHMGDFRGNVQGTVEGLNVTQNAAFMAFCRAKYPTKNPAEIAPKLAIAMLQRVASAKDPRSFSFRKRLYKRWLAILAKKDTTLEQIEADERALLNQLLVEMASPAPKPRPA
jgi:hypothetical protein